MRVPLARRAAAQPDQPAAPRVPARAGPCRLARQHVADTVGLGEIGAHRGNAAQRPGGALQLVRLSLSGDGSSGAGDFLYIYGGEWYPGMGDPNCEFYDRVRGLRSAGDFFRLRLSRDRSSGAWERLVVLGDHPGPMQEINAGVLPRYFDDDGGGGGGGGVGGDRIILWGGYRSCSGGDTKNWESVEGWNMGRDEPPGENNGSPYSRTAYIFEHGVWRRLERLGDTGIAKTAQNWILPVASRRFHSAHTRDRRRQPEASCFYVIDGYGVTGQSQIMENLEFPPGMPQPSLNATSVAPELMRTWMHCTLFDPWMVGLRERRRWGGDLSGKRLSCRDRPG